MYRQSNGRLSALAALTSLMLAACTQQAQQTVRHPLAEQLAISEAQMTALDKTSGGQSIRYTRCGSRLCSRKGDTLSWVQELGWQLSRHWQEPALAQSFDSLRQNDTLIFRLKAEEQRRTELKEARLKRYDNGVAAFFSCQLEQNGLMYSRKLFTQLWFNRDGKLVKYSTLVNIDPRWSTNATKISVQASCSYPNVF